MLKVVIPDNIEKIKRQIFALEWQLTQDTREKDIQIHTGALNTLKKALASK